MCSPFPAFDECRSPVFLARRSPLRSGGSAPCLRGDGYAGGGPGRPTYPPCPRNAAGCLLERAPRLNPAGARARAGVIDEVSARTRVCKHDRDEDAPAAVPPPLDGRGEKTRLALHRGSPAGFCPKGLSWARLSCLVPGSRAPGSAEGWPGPAGRGLRAGRAVRSAPFDGRKQETEQTGCD